MKLALLLVLATLAVFCHSATAVACPALWNAAAKFLYGSVQDYVDAITPFAQTPIMQATERQLKQCVQDSVTDKTALAFLVALQSLPTMHRAWVGTWKPHRPRGPIMAQFTSPGPKYSIPGTTGYLKHDPTKKQAPAYTCSGAKPPVKEGCSPGPCYYVDSSMTRTGKYVAPGYIMCGRPKVTTEITPGPGDYFLEKSKNHIYKCAPAHSMSFRHKTVSIDSTPGPGTYTIPRVMGPNTVYTTASPCYSMKWRSKPGLSEKDLCKTPGPAAYRKTELEVYKTRAPKYTMRTHSKPIGDKTVKPGPADYYIGKVTLTKPQAPAITFGIRHSKYTAPLILNT